ncbi:MAG: aspartate/glutamate racemase family protein [Desulfarculaceae bacterium]|jgi:hypothetical protein
MSPEHRDIKKPPLGIIMLDHELTRPPGDPGNPGTFAFLTLRKVLPGVSLERILQGDPAIVDPLIAAGRELMDQGAWAITTGCGFFVLFQAEVAQALTIPVLLSSLLQIPLVQAGLGQSGRVGVLTAHSGRLTPAHLKAAGVKEPESVTIAGLEDQPHFREGVLTKRGRYDAGAMEKEIKATAQALILKDPKVQALVLECTNLPPFARAIQAEVGLPVFDVTTLINYAYQARFRSDFERKGV